MAKKKTTLDEIKEIEEEDFPLYIVARKHKKHRHNKNVPYEDIECFTDYDKATEFVDIDRARYPEYLYRIDEI